MRSVYMYVYIYIYIYIYPHSHIYPDNVCKISRKYITIRMIFKIHLRYIKYVVIMHYVRVALSRRPSLKVRRDMPNISTVDNYRMAHRIWLERKLNFSGMRRDRRKIFSVSCFAEPYICKQWLVLISEEIFF